MNNKLKFEIKTKRLVIRPLVTTDYEAWKTAWDQIEEQLNEWDFHPDKYPITSINEFKKILSKQGQQLRADEFYFFAVFLKKTGELIGSVSLMDVSRGIFQNGYLGYYVFNPFWGNGYAFEACKSLINFGFKKLNLHRIEAAINPRNRRSIMLARKLRLKKEGFSPRLLYRHGTWEDFTKYAATCEDFGIKWRE
ncbi:MAG: GNAT family N-acetyltransferase [Halobacteriovoraceae bacterium]|jgi:[ribosomal protein S5]-alanine N-acetyltransferase|nr:GNAT family N-acetyltransferase [Halobacteriovoraceae bacterium]